MREIIKEDYEIEPGVVEVFEFRDLFKRTCLFAFIGMMAVIITILALLY